MADEAVLGPLADEFQINDQTKGHVSYGVCVLGMTGTGAIMGSMAGGQTLLGAAGGMVVGLVLCKTVETPIKRKLFGANERMTEGEFRALASQVGNSYPTLTPNQVLDLIAAARLAAIKDPNKYQC
jgi:hypothetical protein